MLVELATRVYTTSQLPLTVGRMNAHLAAPGGRESSPHHEALCYLLRRTLNAHDFGNFDAMPKVVQDHLGHSRNQRTSAWRNLRGELNRFPSADPSEAELKEVTSWMAARWPNVALSARTTLVGRSTCAAGPCSRVCACVAAPPKCGVTTCACMQTRPSAATRPLAPAPAPAPAPAVPAAAAVTAVLVLVSSDCTCAIVISCNMC